MRYGTTIVGTTEARIRGEKREGRFGAGRAGGGGRGRGGQAGIFIGRAPRPLHWEQGPADAFEPAQYCAMNTA